MPGYFFSPRCEGDPEKSAELISGTPEIFRENFFVEENNWRKIY